MENIATYFSLQVKASFFRSLVLFLLIMPGHSIAVDRWHGNLVDLDQFDINDGDDVTDIIKTLARSNAPKLYLKFPGGVERLKMDFVDFTEFGIRELVLLEPDTPITIVQVSGSENKNILFKIDNYKYVYIGGPRRNLTFKGLHKGIRGGHNARVLGDLGEGLLSFSQKQYAQGSLYFSANVIDSRIYGLDHRGNTHGDHRSESISIKGKFTNSGLRLNSGFRKADLDVHVSDPYGVGFGWDGSGKSKNNGWNRIPPYWERSRGVSVTYADQITGRAILEYGKATWFMSSVARIGESKESPFRFLYKDLGFSVTGTKIRTVGFLDTGGKIDHTGPAPDGKGRFLAFNELPHDYGYGLRSSVVLEATSGDGDGGQVYFNELVSIQLDGISQRVTTALLDYKGDYSHRHFVTGNQVSRGGQLPLLEVHESDVVRNFSGYRIKIKSFPKLQRAGKNNLLENIVIEDGGAITIDGSATNNTITNVEFKGSERTVIHIANGDYKGPETTLVVSGISAARGSLLSADKPDKISVELDGKKIELPYQFGGAR